MQNFFSGLVGVDLDDMRVFVDGKQIEFFIVTSIAKQCSNKYMVNMTGDSPYYDLDQIEKLFGICDEVELSESFDGDYRIWNLRFSLRR